MTANLKLYLKELGRYKHIKLIKLQLIYTVNKVLNLILNGTAFIQRCNIVYVHNKMLKKVLWSEIRV